MTFEMKFDKFHGGDNVSMIFLFFSFFFFDKLFARFLRVCSSFVRRERFIKIREILFRPVLVYFPRFHFVDFPSRMENSFEFF